MQALKLEERVCRESRQCPVLNELFTCPTPNKVEASDQPQQALMVFQLATLI